MAPGTVIGEGMAHSVGRGVKAAAAAIAELRRAGVPLHEAEEAHVHVRADSTFMLHDLNDALDQVCAGLNPEVELSFDSRCEPGLLAEVLIMIKLAYAIAVTTELDKGEA